SGSPISSITVRSSSVSAPTISTSTSLCRSLANCLIILGKRLNTVSIGTIRIVKIIFCKSLDTRDILSTVSCSSLLFNSDEICSKRPRSITSSSNKFINISSLSIFTRIVLVGVFLVCLGALSLDCVAFCFFSVAAFFSVTVVVFFVLDCFFKYFFNLFFFNFFKNIIITFFFFLFFFMCCILLHYRRCIFSFCFFFLRLLGKW